MSNYDGTGSHYQSQSNSSLNAQTVNMDDLQNQVSDGRLENVEHYFDDNIDKELEGRGRGGRRYFRHFLSVACLMFAIPSRRIITKDIFDIYGGLKGKDEHEAISHIRSAIMYIGILQLGGKGDRVKSELEKYLGEDVEMLRDKFDILNWWKVNTQRFPILSKMARDVLAVPISTFTSESAFSTAGRVLDAFRSYLSPKIVQALFVLNIDFGKTPNQLALEDLSELEVVEKGYVKIEVDIASGMVLSLFCDCEFVICKVMNPLLSFT
ncbi:Zinc finger BED domain-containing protein RICESLEEPER 2 [Sesamum angolense]|uniref:Zinc finger BED domain-containing protein RICESLEEPER 2 n=1 Tax=Sesamum angolense TaxID=2727404 RepID=A0AAE1T6F1_9LAMI|nr:Zinc finger BED domain-containing protein RICESLEEPER 2 [Sesamum angolense]